MQVKKFAPQSPLGYEFANYTYDSFNRMVKRQTGTFDIRSNKNTFTRDQYFAGYEGINPTLEFETTGTQSAPAATESNLKHRYLWGPQVDQLLANEQYGSTAGGASSPASGPGNTLWALPDHLGTIRDIADFDTAANPGVFSIVNHRVFDSFGNMTSQTSSSASASIAFRYTGKYFDSLTGLSHHWNRWYDPKLGKWISEDPIGFAGGDANLSRYVGNRVTRLRDPNGLDWLDAAANFSAGLGDTMSLGLGWVVRDGIFGIETIDYESNGYYWGGWGGVAVDVGSGGTTAIVKGLGKGAAKGIGTAVAREGGEAGVKTIVREVLEQSIRGVDDLIRSVDDVTKHADDIIKSNDLAIRKADEVLKQADETLKIVDETPKPSKLLDELLIPKERATFPKNPDELLPELPRDVKGHIYPNQNTRIRPGQHPLKPGETHTPRHHEQHYHVEIRKDPTKSFNNKKNVIKVQPPGYKPGDGTGFLPGEKFPGL